jgi:hypothetical protein
MTTHEPRYVFDTNALVSAALFERYTPGRAFRWALRHGQVLTSPDTLEELDTIVLAHDLPEHGLTCGDVRCCGARLCG